MNGPERAPPEIEDGRHDDRGAEEHRDAQGGSAEPPIERRRGRAVDRRARPRPARPPGAVHRQGWGRCGRPRPSWRRLPDGGRPQTAMLDLVQRWRIVYAPRPRPPPTSPSAPSSRRGSGPCSPHGLPVVGVAAGRPRLGFAIPLPVGLIAGAERFDLPAHGAAHGPRPSASALEPAVPADHAIVDLARRLDGRAIARASQVAAVDYRLVVRPAAPGVTVEDTPAQGAPTPDTLAPDALEAACRRPARERRVDRVRRKADREVAYDLRPFVLALQRPRTMPWWRALDAPGGRPEGGRRTARRGARGRGGRARRAARDGRGHPRAALARGRARAFRLRRARLRLVESPDDRRRRRRPV